MVKRIPMMAKRDSPFKIILEEQSRLKNEQRKKVRGSLYASDYGQCMRKVWFQFFPDLYPPESGIDGRLARIFANGEAVHIRLGEYLKMEDSLRFQDEVNVPRDELDVHGRCDGLVDMDGQTQVVEFKSINRSYLPGPKPEHVGQLMWYLHMFEKRRVQLRASLGIGDDELVTDQSLEDPVDASGDAVVLSDVDRRLLLSSGVLRGELIYESKADQSLHSFPIEYDVKKAEEIEMWFKALKKQVDNREMPSVHHDGSGYPCVWGRGTNVGKCDFYRYCHSRKEVLPDEGGDDILGE